MILMQSPQIMLCKPSTNDRFDRRVIELAAFFHRTGHCNVPDVSCWSTTKVYHVALNTSVR